MVIYSKISFILFISFDGFKSIFKIFPPLFLFNDLFITMRTCCNVLAVVIQQELVIIFFQNLIK